MSELVKRIGIELTRTEELIRNKHRIYGFSSDNIKIELSEETYHELIGELIEKRIKASVLPETIFGIEFEVKENLKRDFIIYIDSFNLR